MARPTCPRRITHSPRATYYKPAGIPLCELREVELGADELEAIRLADVEDLWSTHPATRERVSLAIYGEVRNLDDWLVRGYRKFALGVITGGMHGGLKNTADGKDACRAVENVITDLRAGAKQ